MHKLPNMIDMARTISEIKDATAPITPVYPYGLGICLGTEELEKMGVDYDDWQVGDTFHLFCLSKITSIRKSETTEGEDCRVEMQICEIAGEDEDLENEENDEAE